MKRFRITALISLIILGGCNQNSYRDIWPEVESINIGETKSAVFSPEIIEQSRELIHAHHFYIISDSILVTVNKPSTEQKVVLVSNLRSKETIAECLQYGNGPNEVLVVTDFLLGNTLYINDVAKKKLLSIDINTLVNRGKNQQEIDVFDYQFYGSTPFVIPFDDNSVLCENPYCFSDRQLKITNGAVNRFDRLSSNTPVDNKHYRFNTFNVSQGLLVPIRKNNLVFYASLFQPRIELYDTLGVRRKLFTGPTELPIEYTIDHEDDRILFKNKIPYAFLGFCVTANHVYFNYIGSYLEDGYEKMHSTIMKFDMDGNFMEAFVLPKYVSSFTVVNDSLIYGKGYDQQGESVLWKFSAD